MPRSIHKSITLTVLAASLKTRIEAAYPGESGVFDNAYEVMLFADPANVGTAQVGDASVQNVPLKRQSNYTQPGTPSTIYVSGVAGEILHLEIHVN